jgi:hypothetical protein
MELSGEIKPVSLSATDVMEKWIGNLRDKETRSRCSKRQRDDDDRRPTRQARSAKNAAFFGRKSSRRDDDPIEGEQRQPLGIKYRENIVKGSDDLFCVWRSDKCPCSVQKFNFLQQVTSHLASLRQKFGDVCQGTGRDANIAGKRALLQRDHSERDYCRHRKYGERRALSRTLLQMDDPDGNLCH